MFSWLGQSGFSYFIQASPDLLDWTWAPNIEPGVDAPMSYEVDGPSAAGFFRLIRTDQTAADLDAADFDNDGLSNNFELTPRPRPGGVPIGFNINPNIQTNPLRADTDGDGLNDKWELENGLDPTDSGSRDPKNGPNGDPDGDGVTNLNEQLLGTNPKQSDSDGDQINDAEDAGPTDAVVNWYKTAAPKFAVIDLGIEDSENLVFHDLSDRGTILLTDLQQSPNQRVVIDCAQQRHDLPCVPPDFSSPPGYFGVPTFTLLGDSILGTRLLPPAPGTSEDCTWDPVSGDYTPHEVFWYIDDVLDDRGEFSVEKSFEIVQIDGDPYLFEFLWTAHGALADSGSDDFQQSKIELNGNIVSSSGYWIFNSSTNTYGQRSAMPEQCVTNSATLIQVDQSVWGINDGRIRQESQWHLAAGTDSLLVKRGFGSFVKSAVTCESGEVPVAVTSQGWLATTHKIWVSGKWIPLTDLVSGPVPQQVTLLGMLDSGLGVARLSFADESSKLVLLAPIEVRGYVGGESRESVGTINGSNVVELKRGAIPSMDDYTGLRTAAKDRLKIAQWGENYIFDANQNDAFDHDKFKTDVDIFRVRLPILQIPAGSTEHRIKIWTTDKTGAVLDSGAEVDLNPIPQNPSVPNSPIKFHETAALALVADDETDDDFAVEGKQDGALGDRTYRAVLGGKVMIEWLTAPGTGAKPLIEMSVPAERVVKVQGFVLKGTGGNPTAWCERAKKIYSAVGVDLEFLQLKHIDPLPTGVDISNGFNVPTETAAHLHQMRAETIALMDFKDCKVAEDVIPVFIVNQLNDANGSVGVTNVPSFMVSGEARYGGAIFINSNHTKESVLAHEIAHVLLDAQHDPSSNALWNGYFTGQKVYVWWGDISSVTWSETGINAHRRFCDTMRSRILKSRYAKIPAP